MLSLSSALYKVATGVEGSAKLDFVQQEQTSLNYRVLRSLALSSLYVTQLKCTKSSFDFGKEKSLLKRRREIRHEAMRPWPKLFPQETASKLPHEETHITEWRKE